MATTTPRKAAPTKAATAARSEARRKTPGTATLSVPFRGQSFEVPPERYASRQVHNRMLFAQQFKVSDDPVVMTRQIENTVKIVYMLLGPAQASQFLTLTDNDEDPYGGVREFLAAFNKASGVPNS